MVRPGVRWSEASAVNSSSHSGGDGDGAATDSF